MNTSVEFFTMAALACVVASAACGELPACQSDIVSSSVIATYCGHRDGDGERLDLLILWRGEPGWFFKPGARGSSGYSSGADQTVGQYQSYGGVTVGFDADFARRRAVIGPLTVSLDRENTVFIDHADGEWQLSGKTWTSPEVPLGKDHNVVLATRSREVLEYLRCEVPMPPRRPFPVMTVCEKLRH